MPKCDRIRRSYRQIGKADYCRPPYRNAEKVARGDATRGTVPIAVFSAPPREPLVLDAPAFTTARRLPALLSCVSCLSSLYRGWHSSFAAVMAKPHEATSNPALPLGAAAPLFMRLSHAGVVKAGHPAVAAMEAWEAIPLSIARAVGAVFGLQQSVQRLFPVLPHASVPAKC